MKIAMLHYSAPPVVGGVEQTIFYHARGLACAGHAVTLIAGSAGACEPQLSLHVIPEAGSRHPDVLAVQAELACGAVPSAFHALRDRLAGSLREVLAGCDALIAHNVFTLHKNLALTAALRLVLDEPRPAGATRARLRVIAWHHDLAWTDPQYRPQLHAGYPWELLRSPWPGVRQVTVSGARRAELAALYGLAPDCIEVVPPGVDPALFFRWDPVTAVLVERYALLAAGPLLLLPARLTRRKNIELALRVLAALRQLPAAAGQDARLIVTGPPGPHNPANLEYLRSLVELRRELGLVAAAHFLYESEPSLPDRVLADLYQLCDALLLPSTQEGFGIPVLEAGLARLPIFCSDLLPLRETGAGSAYFFDPAGDPGAIAALIAGVLDGDRAFRLRRRVLSTYTWSRIVQERILPLLR